MLGQGFIPTGTRTTIAWEPAKAATLESFDDAGMEYWHIRSLHNAKEMARSCGVEVNSRIHTVRGTWAGHIARLGLKDCQPHVCKYLLAWRPLAWWRKQQIFNLCSNDSIFHPLGWGQPRRWEGNFPLDWMRLADYSESGLS